MALWEPLEYLGETLVFIGVVGEVYADGREPERKKLAKGSSIVLVIGLALSLASLIGTNDYFNGTIAALNLKASQANEHAAREEVEAASARELAGAANQRAATLQKQAASLRKEAEDERIARTKIEERLAWRRVSPSKYKHFVALLSPYAGASVYLILEGNGDPDTDTFAADIAKLLHDSHWNVTTGSNTVIPAPRGLICQVDDTKAAGKALTIVLKQLPGARIERGARLPIGVVGAITVGLRPPP